MKIKETVANQEMKKLDYLLRDSQMRHETFELAAALNNSCFELSDILTIKKYADVLMQYYNGHINIYDVMIAIVRKNEIEN